MIASLIRISLLIDGLKTELKLLNGQVFKYSNPEKIINLVIARAFGPHFAVKQYVSGISSLACHTKLQNCFHVHMPKFGAKCDVTLPWEQNSWISTIFLDMKRLKRSTGYRVLESNHAQESHTCQFCLFFPHICNKTTVGWDQEPLWFLLTSRNFATMATWRIDLFSIVLGWVITRWVIIKKLESRLRSKRKVPIIRAFSISFSLFFWHDALMSSLILWFD